MTPEEIPQELVDLVDRRAGRAHTPDGAVLSTLAEVLTRFEELRGRTHDLGDLTLLGVFGKECGIPRGTTDSWRAYRNHPTHPSYLPEPLTRVGKNDLYSRRALTTWYALWLAIHPEAKMPERPLPT